MFLVQMSDGSALASPVHLTVGNGNALTGFPPGPQAVLKKDVPAADPTTGPGFTPTGNQLRAYAYTTSINQVDGTSPETPGVGTVTIDVASFVRDTADTTNTSMKLDLYLTASTVFQVIIETLE